MCYADTQRFRGGAASRTEAVASYRLTTFRHRSLSASQRCDHCPGLHGVLWLAMAAVVASKRARPGDPVRYPRSAVLSFRSRCTAFTSFLAGLAAVDRSLPVVFRHRHRRPCFLRFLLFYTIWFDVLYRIAHFVEGDRNARIRLEKSPFNGRKILRRGVSRSLWLLLSFATGLTFALYWGEARQLVSAFFVGEGPIPMYWTVAILTTTFALGGYAREAGCQHMCPYSRFQSAMIDNGTCSIRYDSNRGEDTLGRHKALRGYQLQSERQAKGVGDCIDCGYCVQVCPTAIDIRDGAQLACINCGLCADACDQIMDRQGWSRGLIGFYAQPQQSRQMPRALPLKSIGYGLALLLSCAALFADIATDPDVSGVALQMREPLYRVTSDGKIVNSYELKLRNHTSVEHRLSLRLAGLADADLRASNYHDLRIPPQQEIAVPVSVVAPASPDEVAAKPHSRHFSFQLERVGEDQLELPARFFMP